MGGSAGGGGWGGEKLERGIVGRRPPRKEDRKKDDLVTLHQRRHLKKSLGRGVPGSRGRGEKSRGNVLGRGGLA